MKLAVVGGAMHLLVVGILVVSSWKAMASVPVAAAGESNLAGWFIPLIDFPVTLGLLALSNVGMLSGVWVDVFVNAAYLIGGTLCYAALGFLIGMLLQVNVDR